MYYHMYSIAIASFILFALLKSWWSSKKARGLPPGPPALPLIGNLHQIPTQKRWLQFQRWAQTYGPIFTVFMGSKPVIVLTSPETVKDLLDKRGHIYSSRPVSYISDISTGGLHFAGMQYNNTWKMCHRVFANHLNTKAAKRYYPYLELENRQLLHSLLESPEAFRGHISRYAYSFTSQMVFGFRTPRSSDPNLVRLHECFAEWSALEGQTMTALADIYPVLQYLPDILFPTRRYARASYNKQLAIFLEHWSGAKVRIVGETAHPCFAHDLLQAQEKEGLSDELAAFICGILLTAGSDTVAAELSAFVQAMVLFPRFQERAQEELDRVCGDKLPTKDNAASLPYVHACIKETCRWMPMPVMGIPHATTQDDEYMDYHIPKGAMIFLNVWGIHMDPARHPRPRDFDPSRYLHDTKSMRESMLSPDPDERDHYVFGAGRRMCQGVDLAENSLFLSIARILWAFTISKAADPDGQGDITPDPEALVGGLAVAPAPFPAKIVPRSEKRALVVREEWSSAQAALRAEDQQWRGFKDDMRATHSAELY
ncbi:Cytochrome P450 monooxygenase yanC [Apiospora marii]|uniref:Cytochrome P450 monooxygenase yanC n=1 Tax=Apiospora marii TaxID=335849 RepID=A0ABR1RVC0_9PEZI